LGRKLDEFFQVQFAGTVQRVVAIGTDCPDLPVDFVSQAFELLRESPVVLGPATDGGYYLIGMNSFVPVFTDIDWSTDKVFAQTTRKLRQLSIRFATLPLWSDVDVNEDLRQLTDRLAKRTDLDAQHLLHRIDEILLAVRK
jgi:glycosyltransferase A (GT-A) superfamily protein (DUF2064 family)